MAEQVANRQELERLQLLVNGSSEAVVVVGWDGQVVDTNPAYHQMMGYSREEVLTMNSLDIIHPEDLPRIVEHFERQLDDPGVGPAADIRIQHKDGSWRWLETRLQRHPDMDDVVVVNARDVSERRGGEQLLQGQSRVLELIARGVPLADTVAAVSEVIEQRVDDARTGVIVHADAALVRAPDLPAEWRRDVTIGLMNDAPAADGLDGWLGTLAVQYGLSHGYATPIRDRDGRDLGRILLYRDAKDVPGKVQQQALESLASLLAIAVERQAVEAELAHQAHHDQLTGLMNRNGFVVELDRMIERGDNPRAVLFVDLDRFKEINDRHGHRFGDLVLEEIARRLRKNIRRSDLLARFGGDEFVAVLGAIGENDAEPFARRMLEALEAPIFVDGTEVGVSASIGIAAPGDTEIDTAELLQQADVAMFRAKGATRSRIVHFAGDEEVQVFREGAR